MIRAMKSLALLFLPVIAIAAEAPIDAEHVFANLGGTKPAPADEEAE